MFLVESPLNDLMEHKDFNNFFNWTVTYRWDSDFPLPYARIYPAHHPDQGDAWTNDNLPNLSYPIGNGNFVIKYY